MQHKILQLTGNLVVRPINFSQKEYHTQSVDRTPGDRHHFKMNNQLGRNTRSVPAK